MNLIRRLKYLEMAVGVLRQRFNRVEDRDKPFVQDIILRKNYLLAKSDFWTANGMKTFLLSKDLIEAFIHTDVSYRLCPNDFHYPFDSFVIEGETPLFYTDVQDVPDLVPDGRKITLPVYCIMFTNLKELVRNAELPIINIKDGKPAKDLGSHYSVNALFSENEFEMLEISLNLLDDQSIESCVGQVDRSYINGPAEDSDMRNMCNLFFNTVLYINDPSRNIQETQSVRSRKLKVDGKKTVRNEYIHLRPPKSYRAIGMNSGRKVGVKFLVRGHWRNQAVGEGRKSHKRIWIFPHWKGPELSEIISKPYKVD